MRQKKFGKCSICGMGAELSADHIPPKCCGNGSDTYYIQFTPAFLGEGVKCKPLHSQNGLIFANICHNCNNTMGSKYDIHLQRFRDCVLSLINETPYSGKFNLENVCKSVIGHFLAASRYDSCVFAQSMRNYYLNDDKTIYEKYSLLCAYYPYKNSIFSLNNYVPINLCGDSIPEGMISSLYFYPFAFIFCEKQFSNLRFLMLLLVFNLIISFLPAQRKRNNSRCGQAYVQIKLLMVVMRSAELSVYDIGDAMGCTPQYVSQEIGRARKTIERFLR